MNADTRAGPKRWMSWPTRRRWRRFLRVKPMSAPGMSCRSRKCLESRRATPLFLPNERFIAYKRLVVEPQLLR